MKISWHYYSLTLCAFLFLSSCRQTSPQQKKIVDQFKIAETFTVNPTDTTILKATDVIKDLEFIPLETKRDCLFSKIDKMLVTNQYFVILDKASSTIYFFEKDGKFSHKIDKNTLHLTKQEKIWDFDIDSNKLYVKPLSARQILIMDYNGQQTGSLPVSSDFLDFKISGSRSYFYTAYLQKEKDSIFSLITYQGAKKTYFFPYDQEKMRQGMFFDSENSFFKSGNNFYFSMAGRNSFFKLNNSELTAYKIKLPNYAQLPEDFLSNFNTYTKEYITKTNRNVIWNITNIYQSDSTYLTLNLQSMNKLFFTIFIDLKTGKVINARNLSYGNESLFQPIFEKKIVASDGQCFYGELSSKFMFEMYLDSRSLIKEEETGILSEFFSSSDAHSNPVITKFKIKTLN